MKPKTGYCINCDNRHGCKSGTPPCIAEMAKNKITAMSGRRYLIESGRIDRCKECHFFRSCWNVEEYNRFTRQMEKK